MGKICKWIFKHNKFRKSKATKSSDRIKLATQNFYAEKANTKDIGIYTENIALKYLQAQGLVLVEKNFVAKTGEIDLIMKDKQTLVFVEVRYRKSNKYGGASASVTKSKQIKLIKTAQFYLLKHKSNGSRFDVISMNNDANARPQVENWIKNAFMSQ